MRLDRHCLNGFAIMLFTKGKMRNRYIQNEILAILSDQKRHTIGEIARRIEVSYKTVWRHIQDLSLTFTITTIQGGTFRGGVQCLNKNEILVEELDAKEKKLLIEVLKIYGEKIRNNQTARLLEKLKKIFGMTE